MGKTVSSCLSYILKNKLFLLKWSIFQNAANSFTAINVDQTTVILSQSRVDHVLISQTILGNIASTWSQCDSSKFYCICKPHTVCVAYGQVLNVHV